jgi:alkylation response protein AidB-like acyl-CoA dehydrogenase
VLEELLAAGAPVGAHWIADRQSGPLLLRFGTEEQRQRFLPAIARGEQFFCIGFSEPGTGSDLAAVRTRARKVTGGWRVNGTKLWTTLADRAHMMIALVRTSGEADARHVGLSQLLVAPVRAQESLCARGRHAGEVTSTKWCSKIPVGDEMLIRREGQGWRQATAELSSSAAETLSQLFSAHARVVGGAGQNPPRQFVFDR